MSADWTENAACKGEPSDIFFPEAGLGPAPYERAKRVCASCPVRGDCLDFALRTEQHYGIYGGMTPGERQRLEDLLFEQRRVQLR